MPPRNKASLAPVLSFASTKGGVGKSTLAFALACEFARRLDTPAPGAPVCRVIVIDADPNGTASDCINLGKPPNIGAVRATADTLLAALKAARREADLVLVDLEGSSNQAMLYAIGRSSLVLIPAQPSRFDVIEALKTMRVVAHAAELVDRAIEARVVLARTPVLRQQVTAHARAQFASRGLPMLSAELVERAAFRKLSFVGRPVWEVDPAGAASGAALNIAAIADEISPSLGFQWAREAPAA